MLQEVHKTFHYDFRHDFELITNLSMHIVPLRLRLLYDMPFDNPMVSEICERTPLSFEMAIFCPPFTSMKSSRSRSLKSICRRLWAEELAK